MHRLALALGRTVEQLGTEMSAGEFETWKEFYRLEPFGSMRDNMHAGIIAMSVVNMLKSAKSKPVDLKAFMIAAPEERIQSEVGSAFAALKALAKPKSEKKDGSRKTGRKARSADR